MEGREPPDYALGVFRDSRSDVVHDHHRIWQRLGCEKLKIEKMNARQRVLTSLCRKGISDRIPFEIRWGAFTLLLMKTYREKTGADRP